MAERRARRGKETPPEANEANQVSNSSATGRPIPPPLPKSPNADKKPIVNEGSPRKALNTQWLLIGVSSVAAIVVWGLLIWNFANGGKATDQTTVANRETSDKDASAVSAGHPDDSTEAKARKDDALLSQIEANVETELKTSADPDESETAPDVSVASTSDEPAPLTDPASPADEKTDTKPENNPEPELSLVDSTSNTGPTAADLDELIQLSATMIKAIEGKATPKSFKDATQPLRKASNLFRKELRPDFYLGLVHSGIGINDPETARIHFRRVLDRSPGHVAAANNLALVEIKSHHFAIARACFETAAKHDPRPVQVNQNLGRLISLTRTYDLKSDELKRLATLNNQAVGYRSQTGWMYMPLDDSERSMTEYKSFCMDGKLEDTWCAKCSGAAGLRCPSCNRSGAVLVYGTANETRQFLFGSVAMQTPTTTMVKCAKCSGKGWVDCPDCVNGHDPNLRSR